MKKPHPDGLDRLLKLAPNDLKSLTKGSAFLFHGKKKDTAPKKGVTSASLPSPDEEFLLDQTPPENKLK